MNSYASAVARSRPAGVAQIETRKRASPRHLTLLMLDVRRMRVLREVATRGTIAAAAEALDFTPSAVPPGLGVAFIPELARQPDAGIAYVTPEEPIGRTIAVACRAGGRGSPAVAAMIDILAAAAP